jgi:hypothetical protein
MSHKTNEQLVLNYSDPSMNYGSNNLRDLILVLQESGKDQDTIYNVLNMIGVPKQRAYDAIEMYTNKKTKDNTKEMGLQEKIKISKQVLTDLEKLSSEDESLKKIVQDMSENITMMVGKQSTKKKSDKEKSANSKLSIHNKIKGLKAVTETLGSGFTVSSINSIVEKYEKIYASQIHSDSVVAMGIVNEMRDYMWIEGVSEIVNSITSTLNENKFSIQVENVYNKLRNSNQNAYFVGAFPVLEQLMGMEEQELVENASYMLHAHTWIPEIKSVVEQINLLNKNANDTNDHVVTKKYSPVIEHNSGYAFNLDGISYLMKNGEIQKIDKNILGAAYLTMLAVEESAKFSENAITFYKGNHVYEIQLNEGGKVFTVDGRELLFREKAQLKNLLVSTCHFNVNENYNIDILTTAYEHAENFVELDFVQNISSRFTKGISANLIRANENLYVNKINKTMQLNEFIKVDSAEAAVNLIKEFINYDVTSLVKDLLNKDAKKQIAIQEAKNQILDKIDFLTEKKSGLKLHDSNNQFITEAYKIIDEEIGQLKSELNKIK